MIQAESAEARKTAAGAMSLRLADPAERSLRLDLLAHLALGDPGRVDALGLDHARVDRVDADLPRAQFLGQRPGHGVDRRLGRAVDRGGRRRRAWTTTELMLMMLPPPGRRP